MRSNTQLYLKIINKNINQIQNDLQLILNNHENGIKEDFCTDLDKLFEVYEEELKKAKSFDKLKISLKKGITQSKFVYIDNLSKIDPENYVEIKNGKYFCHTIEDSNVKMHKQLVVTACDEYEQTKSVKINIIINEKIDEGKSNQELEKIHS